MQCHPQKCVPISIHALRVEGDGCRCLRLPGRGDFYPRPPGGGRPAQLESHKIVNDISIHALRVEGDAATTSTMSLRPVISIHALRVEGDKRLYCFGVLKAYFYPRPPGGGRPGGEFPTLPAGISIHALRVEGDYKVQRRPAGARYFYPRPPGGGRPAVEITPRWRALYFYPRPPGGGRRRPPCLVASRL